MTARFAVPLALIATLALVSSVDAATIVIDNFDSAGEGLNDLTPVSPVGGNGATTLGGQRLVVLETAAATWGGILESAATIHIAAVFDPIFCNATNATLGSTGNNCLHFNFADVPVRRTWYPAALANRLVGEDLCDSADCQTCFAADMTAQFNSSVGTTCAFPRTWYYGLDGNAPPNTIDFRTVVMHEIAHGLGVFSTVNQNGFKLFELDDVYMRNLEDHATGLLYPELTREAREAAGTSGANLHWVGPATVAESGVLTDGVDPGSGHVEMYAPAVFNGGSSVSHFSTDATPNQLMEPFYTEPLFDIGLTRYLLTDLGWELGCGNGTIDPGEACDDGNRRDGDCCSAVCQLDLAGTPCASADLCTVGGTCDVAGTCLGGVADSCDDANPCTDDVCRPNTGCHHFPNSAPCDDSIACTSDDRCELRRCTGDWACDPDRYRVYKTSRQSVSPKLPAQLVNLLDPFEQRWVRTSTLRGLGSPAAIAPNAPNAPAVHLECLKAKDLPIPSTPFAGRRVTVTHDLGTATLDVRKTDSLCVAALTAPSAPPDELIAHHVDHYRCYQAKTSAGSTPLAPQTLAIVDEYGARQQVTGKPTLFCNPAMVQQNGYLVDVIEDPSTSLTCYAIKDASGEPPFQRQNVFTRHRFGTEALRVTKSRQLCLPSTVVIVEPL